MLHQFKFKNFRSFRDEAILSLKASSVDEHSEYLEEFRKEKFLRSAMIYGANASGKTNVFMAMAASTKFIKDSHLKQADDNIVEFQSFMFDDSSINDPISFEYIFSIDDRKYVYGYSVLNNEVVEEYLYLYKTVRPTIIFERSNEKYDYGSQIIEKEFNKYTDLNTKNKLLLSTATQWNCKYTKEPFLYLSNKIIVSPMNHEYLLNLVSPTFVKDIQSDQKLRKFTNNLLGEADINISDYKVEVEEFSHAEFLKTAPVDVQNRLSGDEDSLYKRYSFDTIHKSFVNDNWEYYNLPLYQESKGTISLFLLSPVIKNAIENGLTLFIDELDSSLHPMLFEYILDLFNNASFNKSGAQLVVSSHTTDLLSLEKFRRDQFYFVEKNRKFATSELYPLDDFSVRKTDKIRKNYLLGRYGSIPEIVGW